MGDHQGRFRGRGVELSELHTAVERAVAGSGGVVIIRGPVGIGATRLVHEAIAQLPDSVASALVTPEGPPAPALTTWRQVAKQLGQVRRDGPAAELSRALSRASDSPREHGSLIRQAIVAEAEQGPIVVGIDDLADADPASVDLLADMAGELARHSSLVMTSATGDEAPLGHARWLADLPFVATLVLGPWSQEDTYQAIIDLVPDDGVAAVEAMAMLSGGNPLLAVQLALTRTRGTTLDRRALRVLAERVGHVDDAHAVAALAVLRRAATVGFIARITRTSPVKLRNVLDGAVQAGLLVRHGSIGTYDVAHPVISEAVETWLPPEISSGLHHAIARALREDLGSAGRSSDAAKHLLFAGVQPNEVAAACLEAALGEEESGSLHEAEELATHGLDAFASDVSLRVNLLRVLARCRAARGMDASARELLEQALVQAIPLADPAVQGGVVLDLVAVNERQPIGSLHVEIEAALIRLSDESALRAMLLAALARATPFLDWRRSRALAVEALQLAEALGDPGALAAAQEAWAIGAVGLESAGRAAVFATAWRRGNQVKPLAAARMTIGAALVEGNRGEFDHAVAVLSTDISSARRAGRADAARLMGAMFDGDAPAVESALQRVATSPIAEVQAVGMVAGLIWGYLQQDANLADRTAGLADIVSAPWARLLAAGLTVLGRHLGDDHVDEFVDPLVGGLGARETGHADVGGLFSGAELPWDIAVAVSGFAGGLAGSPQLCQQAIDHLTGHSGRWIVFAMSVAIGPVDWFLAWAHRGLGQLDQALEAADAAIAACRRMGARSNLEHGLALRAEIVAQRADSRAAPATAVSSLPLTERQVRVLELAAQGQTNDQIARSLFLSVSTVERHFTHIYRRLGVRNRAEAVRVWFTARPVETSSA